MSETLIRINDNGRVIVETENRGVKSFKQITPDSLAECINQSLLRGAVHTGLLPKNCISFSAYDNGNKEEQTSAILVPNTKTFHCLVWCLVFVLHKKVILPLAN